MTAPSRPAEVAPRGRLRRWLCILAPGLAPMLLLAPLIATASSPAPDHGSSDDVALSQLGLQRWDRESGLAGTWVRDIVESPEGFLWVATSGGLSRFDGRSFVSFSSANTPQLPSNSITALAVDPGGTLWVGLEQGGVWTMRSGRLTRALPSEALPAAATITGLAATADGAIWVGTDQGLWRLRDGEIEAMAPSFAGPPAVVMALEPSRDGGVWVRTVRRGVWWAHAGKIDLLPTISGCDGYGLAQGRSGTLYTSCTEGIWKLEGGSRSWSLVSRVIGVGPVFVDSREQLWYGVESGLTRRTGGTHETLPPEQGLGDWRIRAWFEDSRGDLWIGTFSAGLARLHRGAVVAYSSAEGLPLEHTTAVLARPDGSIWLGGYEDGLVRWSPRNGLLGRWTSNDGLPSDRVWALAADPRRPHRVWVGTERGLAAIEDDRVVSPLPGHPAVEEPVRLLFADPGDRGSLWIASHAGGLSELRKGRRILHGPAQGLTLDRVGFVLRDHRGRLLAGGDRGLFRLEGEAWLPELSGSVLSELRAAFADEHGVLWLASDIEGLIRSTSEGTTTFGLRQGLPLLPIFSIQADDRGGIWLSTNEGLLRFAVREHQKWQEGLLNALPLEVLSRREGLRDGECNGWGSPSATRLPDGRLLYPTISGIAVVEPHALPEVALRPEQVQILSGWTEVRALEVLEPIRLQPTERSLRIVFTAIERVRPEAIVFRYRLEGHDTGWIPAGMAREASYSHLSPGSFRFRLQARLPGGEWVESSRALPVAVAPTLWETPWLRALVAALAVGLLTAAVSWRLAEEKRRAAAVDRERRFLRNVIDTSPNPIFVRDADGTYSLANRAAAAIYGLEPVQLEGRSPDDLARLPGMEAIEALDGDMLSDGVERRLAEQQIVDGAGEERWFRVVKRPGIDPQGGERKIIGTAVDVTDFKRAELRLRRNEEALQASNDEARELSLKLLRAQEDERERLAREIHDDLSQRLAGLAMLAWGAAREAAEESPGRARVLEELNTELERVASDAQAISRGLHPQILDALGLAEALRSECAGFSNRTGLEVAFTGPRRTTEPPPETALVLYRIVQEGLRNCVAHSGAGSVRVSLEERASGLLLEVADDGVGFDRRAVLAHPGLGLASMAQRARLIGATLDIDTAPGRGTRIVVRVPLAGTESRPSPDGQAE